MKIALLFGGKSTEHEISIITMLQVREYLKDDYELYLLYMSKNNELFLANDTTIDDYQELNKLNKKFKKINFIKKGIKNGRKEYLLDCAIVLNHGKNGEDGLSASLLKYYDIPCVGRNNITSGVLMDKAFTHDILRNNGFLVTKTISYTKEDYLNNVIIDILPCIVKPATLGSSIGISIANTIDELTEALKLAFCYDDKVVIEELLIDFMECNIACYNSEVIETSSIERINKKQDFLSFNDKYKDEQKFRAHEINPDLGLEIEGKIKDIAVGVYNLFGCSGIIRIDLMLKDKDIYVNEVNTIPGALASYLFTDFKSVINKAIKKSILDYKKSNLIISSYETNVLNIKSIKK